MPFIGAINAPSGSVARPGRRRETPKTEASVGVAHDLELEAVKIF